MIPLYLLFKITVMSCCLIILHAENILWPYRLPLPQAPYPCCRSLSAVIAPWTTLLCFFYPDTSLLWALLSLFLHGSFCVS